MLVRRLKVAALSGASAVALGAYGAHTLRPTGPDADYYISTFDRASRYHLTHSLLIAAAPLARCAQQHPCHCLTTKQSMHSAQQDRCHHEDSDIVVAGTRRRPSLVGGLAALGIVLFSGRCVRPARSIAAAHALG